MRILVVGGGGREHALTWKIAASPAVSRIVCAPGNPGMARLGECRQIPATDVAAVTALAMEMSADLVVVGPESALEAGLADHLAAAGVPCFGASAKAAQIETSKAFMKAFALRHDIPTAPYAVFDNARAAKAHLRETSPPFVVKADGLATGKGVVIAETLHDADAAVDACLAKGGGRVVVEAFMQGEEVSVFCLSDGETMAPFGAAQDYKRAFDGDTGPNTGGMGTTSPAPIFTSEIAEEVERRILAPALDGLAREGAPYRGALYAGLMVTDEGPRLVEFNARFGDPECQVLMLRLESDIVPYLVASATGGLADLPPPTWRSEAAICVVLAARGYPEAPVTGSEILGADADLGDGVMVFHASTARRRDGTLAAAGGRVLNVCAIGETLAMARQKAYAAIDQIVWPAGFHRSDIGWRALQAP